MQGRTGWLVAVVAIALSITGSATAAKLITGKQIKNASITGLDIKNRSLGVNDFTSGTYDELTGDQGLPGPAGPTGPAGPVNTAKATPHSNSAPIAPGQVGSVAAFCPPGQNVVMGNASPYITYPGAWGMNSERTSYFLVVHNDSSITVTIEVLAWCVPSGSAVSGRSGRESTQELIDDKVAELKRLRAAAKP